VDVDEPEKRSLGAPLHQSRSHAWDDGNFARRARAPVGPDEEIVLICGQGVFSKALVAVSQQRFGNMLSVAEGHEGWKNKRLPETLVLKAKQLSLPGV
jgi:rhodanese-related sulfurtransferase